MASRGITVLILKKNVTISTEITGYAVSTFSYLHAITGDPSLIARRRWDRLASWRRMRGTRTRIPFLLRLDRTRAYFFDVGIIVRGLLATGADEFCQRARDGALSLAFDFIGDGEFHPIIQLPDKQLGCV